MLRRSSVIKLRENHWFKPAPDAHPELELCIVPSAGTVALDSSGLTPDQHARIVCRDVFIEFRGYVDDDGKAVPNDSDARLELWAMFPISTAIRGEIIQLQTDAFVGEGNAVSA
jgi:hypothetical protein